MNDSSTERTLFVTGRLAEAALRRVLANALRETQYEVRVLGISVAALMHVKWLMRKLTDADGFQRVVLPGLCQGDLQQLSTALNVPCERGPQDLRQLPGFLGSSRPEPPPLDEFATEILAEINHAPGLQLPQLLKQAQVYAAAGADVIDLGCTPGERWSEVATAVHALRDAGLRVSIDSFDGWEVQQAVSAGAELVLSCNHANLDQLADLDVEVVAIPDTPDDLDSLIRLVDRLEQRDMRYRLDPILEPIGFGFAESLFRYYTVRRRWPNASMMMGIGNLTELTEVDSAGVNLLLAAICEELQVGSVLTTQVINWCRSAVAELAFGRRLVHHCLQHNVLPKHLDARLVALRDSRLNEPSVEDLQDLADQITDPNFRILATDDALHLMNRDGHWQDTNPFALFHDAQELSQVDAAHAFYLGYEMCKAATARALGKQYRQDQPLQWGMHTMPEYGAEFRDNPREGTD